MGGVRADIEVPFDGGHGGDLQSLRGVGSQQGNEAVPEEGASSSVTAGASASGRTSTANAGLELPEGCELARRVINEQARHCALWGNLQAHARAHARGVGVPGGGNGDGDGRLPVLAATSDCPVKAKSPAWVLK